nr:aldehyde dehydrogenase family protein [Ileibacterium valens]
MRKELKHMEASAIKALLDGQREFFRTHKTIPTDFRKMQLRRLKESLLLHEDEILQALALDLGKNNKEAYFTEVGMVYSELNYMLKKLSGFTAAKYHWTPIHQFPALSMTIDVPYGNVLIMSPWNYPFQLTLIPLIDALAAGNTAIVKPSDYSSYTSAVIEKVLADAFDPVYVATITGGRAENQVLLDQEFDYIFFTGSKKVGQLVMEKASAHLTPITLELGGKSPCIVDETANLKMAAKRIVFGKFLNAGQTCVAPDYVYVHESVKEEFIALLKHEIAAQYPKPNQIGRIVNQKHFDRLLSLVQPEKVVYGGSASELTLQIAPTVMDNISWDDPVMQEEIFGPILPVLTYNRFMDVMAEIQSRPTPLAFYLFTRDSSRKNFYKKIQPFGGGCINDTIIQLATENMPFGGMGQSGMGQYHGHYGFENFSHTKSIVDKCTLIDLPMRYHAGPEIYDKIIRMVLK